MRALPLVALSLALFAGCTVQTTPTPAGQAGSGQAGNNQAGSAQAGSSQAGSGGSAEGGSGGQAGSGQAGQGGQAGAAADPCEGVPAEGRCLDQQTFERCVVGSPPAEGQPATSPKVIKGSCQPGSVCQQGDGWSGCVPQAACSEGSSYCDGPTVRKVCVGGQWASEPCAGDSTCKAALAGVACVDTSNQAGQTFTIKGHLSYQFRPVKDDRTGYGDLTPGNAQGVIALAYDGNDYLGGTYTDTEGSFAIEVGQKPSAATSLYFIPMLYDEGGTPQFAVAVPDTTDLFNLKSSRYYSYSRQTGEALDTGDLLITEEEGSQAIHIHQWMVYSLLLLRQNLPEAKPFNMVALWAPGKQFSDCGQGSCYAPRGYGATVDYGDGSDFYHGAVLLAGTEETPHHLSASVILHEFGHYATEAFSISPHEAAQHSLSMAAPPGMAWSEGVATYLGQSSKQDKIYFDKQVGTTWYYDVSQPFYSAPKLDPQGPIDQNIGESVVTHMLWHLDDSENESWDQASLGQAALFQAFGSKRMITKSLNRGYKTVDLVDFLDALRCGGASSAAVLSVTQNEGFPYDDAPACP